VGWHTWQLRFLGRALCTVVGDHRLHLLRAHGLDGLRQTHARLIERRNQTVPRSQPFLYDTLRALHLVKYAVYRWR
jgi:hypothetical protein